MRDELDGILIFINEATLTNIEWEEAQNFLPENPELLDEYKALKSILENRSGIGKAIEKLKAYFSAKGVVIPEDDRKNYNNIFIGDTIE
jgi:hypothetical protein